MRQGKNTLKELYFATSNKNKAKEAEAILGLR